MVGLGTLDGPAATTGSSTANGINSDGTIVGAATDERRRRAEPRVRPRPRHGVMTDLGTLGGARSESRHAINDAGVIVGWSWTTGDTATPCVRARARRRDGRSGHAGRDTTASAEDLDESGTVVGWSVTARFTEWCEDYGFVCPQTRAFAYDLAATGSSPS